MTPHPTPPYWRGSPPSAPTDIGSNTTTIHPSASCGYQAASSSDDPRSPPVPGAQRPRRGVEPVLRGRWLVADLRRHPHHQYRPRLALHAGALSRREPRHQGRRRARLLGRHHRGRADRRGARRPDRDPAAAAHLPRAGAVPAARHLRAGARHQRCRAMDLGPGRPARAARARLARLGRDSRAQLSRATTCS